MSTIVEGATLPEYTGGAGNFNTQTPGISGNAQLLYGLQKRNAQKFRQDIPQTADRMYNAYAAQSRNKLATDIGDVRKSYNSRGLLYSGQRRGAEAGARAASQAGNVDYAYNLNKQLLGDAGNMDMGYANTAMSIAGMAPQLGSGLLSTQDQAIQNQMQNWRNDQNLFNAIIGRYTNAAGQLIGAGISGMGSARSNPSSSSSDKWSAYMRSNPSSTSTDKWSAYMRS